MFSKVLALGLAALTLVHAVPTQQVPAVSFSVGIKMSVDTPKFNEVNAFNGIERGLCFIQNVDSGAMLRGLPDGRIIAIPGENIDLFWMWQVERAGGSDEFTISNFALKASAIVDPHGQIVSGESDHNSFTITPAEQGTFVVSVPGKDKVWTVDDSFPAHVSVKGQTGHKSQQWKFIRIDGHGLA
ncbi:hypothetical protein DFH09DRAFT_1355641 [Mycena vulgaris]|nr:hypothetical protein DFH09DRAFT_1355641 [Mycena vulgaris]